MVRRRALLLLLLPLCVTWPDRSRRRRNRRLDGRCFHLGASRACDVAAALSALDPCRRFCDT
jgi:hypothetical protein